MSLNTEQFMSLAGRGDEEGFDFGRIAAQEKFLTDSHQYKMLSGSFATGKTTALCAHILALLSIPGNFGFLGRLDGKALRQTTLVTLLEMLPEEMYTKNDQKGMLDIKPKYGGARLAYGDFKDYNDLKNMPLGFFAIDQTEEIDVKVWNLLSGRLRRRIPILTLEGRRQYKVVGRCPGATDSQDQRHYALSGEKRCNVCGDRLPEYSLKRKRADGSPLPKPTLQQLRKAGGIGEREEGFPTWDVICYNRFGIGACNPEGPDHWIYQMFPNLPSEAKEGDYIYSKGTDHPKFKGQVMGYHSDIYEALEAGFIDELYVASLEAQYGDKPELFKRYCLGLWVHAEGRIYPAFNEKEHTIPKASTRHDGSPILNDEVQVYEYIDHGTTSPTAVGWVALEDCQCGCHQQNIYIIAEHYEGDQTVKYHASIIKNIRAQLPLSITVTYLDSQAFSITYSKQTTDGDTKYSIADEYEDNEIYCVPNQKDWDTGYNRISEALKHDENHIHPVTGVSGAPHLLVVSSLRFFIKEILNYKWSKRRDTGEYQEKPQDGNDHHMDGLRGFLAARPATSGMGVIGHPLDNKLADALEQFEEDIKRFEEDACTWMSE